MDRIEFYNASEIIDMIGLLEHDKISHDNFKRKELIGFSKIHHGSFAGIGSSIVRNVKEYWFQFKKSEIRKDRQNEFQEIRSEYEHYGIPAVLNMMHSRALSNRELKGEWIIFKKHEGKKYYLSLACHYEGDKSIFENKIIKCLSEFPELKRIDK